MKKYKIKIKFEIKRKKKKKYNKEIHDLKIKNI